MVPIQIWVLRQMRTAKMAHELHCVANEHDAHNNMYDWSEAPSVDESLLIVLEHCNILDRQFSLQGFQVRRCARHAFL